MGGLNLPLPEPSPVGCCFSCLFAGSLLSGLVLDE